MQLETLELRDRRYRAQQELKLLKDDNQAAERKALEEQIAHYQEICPHEHVDEVEGEWRCRDCDLRKTTAAAEPEPEIQASATAQATPATEDVSTAETAPATEEAPTTEAAPVAEEALAAEQAPAADEAPSAGEATAGAEPGKPAGTDT